MRNVLFLFSFLVAQCVLSITPVLAKDDLKFLKEGMPYLQARDLLIQNGWKPYSFGKQATHALSACLVRVSPSLSDCDIRNREFCSEVRETCTVLPEYGTCSSEGLCVMVMVNRKEKQLFLNTEGDVEKGSIKDKLKLTGWYFDVWK